MFTPIHRLVSLFKYPVRGEVLSIDEPEIEAPEQPQMYSDEMNEVIIRAARRFLLGGRIRLSKTALGNE